MTVVPFLKLSVLFPSYALGNMTVLLAFPCESAALLVEHRKWNPNYHYPAMIHTAGMSPTIDTYSVLVFYFHRLTLLHAF